MAPPDHKSHKYPPLRDDRGGSRKGDLPPRDRDAWPAERVDRSRIPSHLERRDGPQRERVPYRDSDRRDRPRPAPPASMRRDRDDRELGEKSAEPQQRRPPSSGRAQDAKMAPEARVPGMSVLGTGSNVMEELRKAAMKVKQATAKPQADDDREEGEAEPGEMPSLKRPNPITWQTPPKKPRVADASDESPADSVNARQDRQAGSASASRATSSKQPQPSPAKGAAPLSAADRAARELEEFTMRNHADVDPNAPPAMKASPSVSGDDAEMPETAAADEDPKPDAADEDMADPPVKVARSRWLDEDPEEDPPEPVNTAELDEEAARAEQADRELNEREREGLADGMSPSGRPDDEAQGPGAVRSISMLQKCRDVQVFEKIRRISEGTYGVVYQARDKETGHMCALKKIKMDKEKDGFPQTSIREINILLSFHHPNIVEFSEVVEGDSSDDDEDLSLIEQDDTQTAPLKKCQVRSLTPIKKEGKVPDQVSEVVVGRSLSEIYMVMEYVEHDLKQLSESMKQPFSIAEVKCLMQQLFCGMHYLHENWVLHRDLKTSNILYSNKGELKICDFGLARQYGSPLRPYTHNVVTLWYRAPELLLGCKEYSTAIDMWSLGCIMAELLTKQVLFSEQGEIPQLHKIFGLLGTPSEDNWPGVKKLKVMQQLTFKPLLINHLREKFPAPSFHDDGGRGRLTEEGFKLLNGLLTLCPERRLTAAEALQSRWFTEHPPPKEQALMPTFPDKEAAKHISRPARKQPSPDPRLQPSASAIANRAAEVGTLFSKPGNSIS